MIERLRQVCQADERLEAAMLYGSFALQEGDRYSDIDCLLYFQDERLGEIDQRQWLSQVATLYVYYRNEFGNGAAVFENLVRGEFHFDPASQMEKLESWRGILYFPYPQATILLDRRGRLSQHLRGLSQPPASHDTPQEAETLRNSFFNWTLFGANVLARGEAARAQEILHLLHDDLLRMARLLAGRQERWINPARMAEQELPPGDYLRFQACTARLDPAELRQAYRAAWEWGIELIAQLSTRHDLPAMQELTRKLDRRLEECLGDEL